MQGIQGQKDQVHAYHTCDAEDGRYSCSIRTYLLLWDYLEFGFIEPLLRVVFNTLTASKYIYCLLTRSDIEIKDDSVRPFRSCV